VFVDRTEEGKLTCDTFLLDLRRLRHSVARRWMDLCTPCLGRVIGRRRNVPRFCIVVENNVGFYIRDLSGSIFDDSARRRVTQPSLELGDLAALVCKTNLHLHSWRSALPCTQRPTLATRISNHFLFVVRILRSLEKRGSFAKAGETSNKKLLAQRTAYYPIASTKATCTTKWLRFISLVQS
jgi:hypothetical protein